MILVLFSKRLFCVINIFQTLKILALRIVTYLNNYYDILFDLFVVGKRTYSDLLHSSMRSETSDIYSFIFYFIYSSCFVAGQQEQMDKINTGKEDVSGDPGSPVKPDLCALGQNAWFYYEGFGGATFLPFYCVFREGKDYVVMSKKLGKQLPFAKCLNGGHRMGSCFFQHSGTLGFTLQVALVTWCLCHPAGHAFIFCCGAGNGQLVETAGSQTSLLPHAAKPTSNIQPTKNLTNLVEINGKTQRHHSTSNRLFYDNM